MTDWKKLISAPALAQLIANHKEQQPLKGTRSEKDFKPVVRLHIHATDCMWLLTELEEEHQLAFGLCQIQMAELGHVWLPELADMDIHGLRVVEDTLFVPRLTLSGYATLARERGGILTL